MAHSQVFVVFFCFVNVCFPDDICYNMFTDIRGAMISVERMLNIRDCKYSMFTFTVLLLENLHVKT